MKFAGFDWDAGNWPKCGKHGVSKSEIEFALLHDPMISPDPRHSSVETRFIAIGRNQAGRLMFIGLTFRKRGDRKFLRPITARYMHAKEARRYEAQGSQSSD